MFSLKYAHSNRNSLPHLHHKIPPAILIPQSTHCHTETTKHLLPYCHTHTMKYPLPYSYHKVLTAIVIKQSAHCHTIKYPLLYWYYKVPTAILFHSYHKMPTAILIPQSTHCHTNTTKYPLPYSYHRSGIWIIKFIKNHEF